MKKHKESKEALSLVEPPERSGGCSTNEAAPSTEVSAQARRRTFTADYKRRILREADACKKAGELGALLRREGLYSSALFSWRLARKQGELAGLSKKLGPQAAQLDARDKTIAVQQREITKLKRRAEQAEAIIEIKKKFLSCWGFN